MAHGPRSSSDALPLRALLERLGYTGPEACAAARGALEQAGLTNPRKAAIHPRKEADVVALLASTFSRTCGAEGCRKVLAQAGKALVVVKLANCEACGGRRARLATTRLVAALQSVGYRRLLVAGGAPGSHEELRNALRGSGIKLDVIDGERAPDPARARELARSADVVVVWASTVLSHSASSPLPKRELRGKKVTVPQRSVEALAEKVIKHCEGAAARADRLRMRAP